MRTIFIADAHLVSPDDENYRMLIRFLKELEGNTQTLYVMGDLFDFWLGFPSRPFRQYDKVLGSIGSLVRSGCRLVCFEGNHDFHLGEPFSSDLNAEIHTGPAIVEIQGKKLYLCHGDQINRADHGYRLLRSALHNRLVASLVNHVSPYLATAVKERLQKRSRAGYQKKTEKWDYREIIRSFAHDIQRTEGCDGLVSGHFHLAYLEELDATPFTIMSLGDWISQYTYGEMVDGKMLLRTYPIG